MARTLQISTTLKLGEQTVGKIVQSTSERKLLVLEMDSTQKSTPASTIRLLAFDGSGTVIASTVIVGTGRRSVALRDPPATVKYTAECLAGSALVLLYELTGSEALGLEGISSIESDDLPQVPMWKLAYQWKAVGFTGRNGAGSITVPELLGSERIAFFFGYVKLSSDPLTVASGTFEDVVSTAGELQQLSTSDLSLNGYHAVVLPQYK